MQKLTVKVLLIVVATFLAFNYTSVAQNQEAIQRAKAKYQKSIQYNDFNIAKDAIYDLILLEPNNSSYLDSLALMYLEFGQFASAALVSRDALKRNPNNQVMMQVGAQSLDKLGATDQSLKMYEKLYTISNDAFVLFEIIQKQYALKQLDDAMINTELLWGKREIDGARVYAQDKEGKQIEVPFKSVIKNMQGLIARAQGKEEAAKKYFENALEIAPNYSQAKENLTSSDK